MRGRKARPLTERFWEKVVKGDGDGCWIWIGYVNEKGYGRIARGGTRGPMPYVNRVSWKIHFGAIPDGLFVCHRCDNPPCVRPDHMFLGTHDDNMADMAAKNRAKTSRGEANGNAKLSASDVREIRKRMALQNRQVDIAADFGVGQALISKICVGRNWIESRKRRNA